MTAKYAVIIVCFKLIFVNSNQDTEQKSQSTLPFSLLDKLPFLNKDLSNFELVQPDDSSSKPAIVDLSCPKPQFEEIIFNQKCFSAHSYIREKHSVQVSTESKKVKCTPILRNVTENSTVKLLNSSELMDLLGKNNSSSNHCAVVLFYALWCVFSVRMAPAYNALARAFPTIDIFAIDAYNFTQLSSRFGPLSVPSLMVFHNGKAFSKFNGTERTLESLAEYISNVTGLEPNSSIVIEDFDYVGPLPTKLSEEPDYVLCLSWTFIIVCLVGSIIRFEKGYQFFNALKDLLTHQGGAPHHID